MQKYLLLLFFLPVGNLFSQTKINNAQFKELMKDSMAVILDVRTPEEVTEGKIDQAINVNYFSATFVDQVESLIPKNKTVLVYCAAGARSVEACKQLKKAGYKKLYDLETGYNGWE